MGESEMAVDTYLDHARTCVHAEQEAIGAKLDAYKTFMRRVRDLETEQTPSSTAGITTAGGATHLFADGSGTDRCRTVRSAFDETIQPHSVADIGGAESLLETIREEFTDAIAVALAPTTEPSFTPELKQMVIAEARSRRLEAATLRKALGGEETQLDDAAATVDEINAWVVDATAVVAHCRT